MISLFFLSILIALSGFENNEVSGKSILNLYYIPTDNQGWSYILDGHTFWYKYAMVTVLSIL